MQPVVGSLATQGTHAFRRRVEKLHVLRDEHEAFLFDKETVSVWPLPLGIAPILSDILVGTASLRDEAEAWRSVEPLLTQLWTRLSAFPKDFAFLDGVFQETPQDDSIPRLGKLAINVANDCNLMCSYCYANEGLYESKRGLLGPE